MDDRRIRADGTGNFARSVELYNSSTASNVRISRVCIFVWKTARMHFWIGTKLLFLLVLANGTPVITKDILRERFATPIDAHTKFVDGKPLFGSSKTLRGIFLSILVTSACAPLVALSWRVGALVASLAMAGDLFSSFLKRRMNLRAGDRATGLDQVPESLFPLLACRSVLPLATIDIVAGVAIFFVGEILLSRLFYRVHLRDHPY